MTITVPEPPPRREPDRPRMAVVECWRGKRRKKSRMIMMPVAVCKMCGYRGGCHSYQAWKENIE